MVGSVMVRERERERDWDTESHRSDRPRTHTTVRRYVVPDRKGTEDDRLETSSRWSRRDNDNRSSYRETDNRTSYRETDNRISYRENDNRSSYRDNDNRSSYRDNDNRSSFRDRDAYRDTSVHIDVERSRPPSREIREIRDYAYEPERAPEHREWHISREVSRDPPRRDTSDRELERYSRYTDYYSRPEQPQPIIIRQDAPQPIIIREPAPQQEIVLREELRPSPKYELVEQVEERDRDRQSVHESVRESVREEAPRQEERNTSININVNEEDRQVARREDLPAPAPPEDEYYYQRTVRKLAPHEREEKRDEYDDYRRDRRVKRRGKEDDGYSDEDYYYKRTESFDDGRSRSRHRRHIAEGAVAGLGARWASQESPRLFRVTQSIRVTGG